MKFKQTLMLKSGKACIIRHAEAADAAEVRRSFLQTHAETDNLLTYPDESKMTVESEADFLQKTADSENAVELCAVVDGKLVGMAGVEPIGAREKLRHRAEFGISIEKAYWGQGIGRALRRRALPLPERQGTCSLNCKSLPTTLRRSRCTKAWDLRSPAETRSVSVLARPDGSRCS